MSAHTSLPRHGVPTPSIPYLSEPSEGRLWSLRSWDSFSDLPAYMLLQSLTLLQSPTCNYSNRGAVRERGIPFVAVPGIFSSRHSALQNLHSIQSRSFHRASSVSYRQYVIPGTAVQNTCISRLLPPGPGRELCHGWTAR